MDVTSVIAENKKRLKDFYYKYNPILGIGSKVKRTEFTYVGSEGNKNTFLVPQKMLEHLIIKRIHKLGSIEKYLIEVEEQPTPELITFIEDIIVEIRFDYDFEFWAISTVKIQDKKSKRKIPFRLNRPQRRLLGELESERTSEKAIRLILLKARQWGGSTLIQIYMAWIQVRLRTSWHSAIVADVEDQSKNIRSMFTKLAEAYPKEVGSITFKPFEGSTKNRLIKERECVVGVGSAQKPESLRSFDFAMLHLSEVGLWKSTPSKSAEDLIQSLQATVPEEPYTLICLESTAKGVGNFFHRSWQTCEKGDSAYVGFFVPWWEIELYQKKCKDYEKFIAGWTEYEWFLWELGATIEGINWYMSTMIGYDYDEWRMKSEYPSTADEAFQSSGRRAFAQRYVLNARKTCKPPKFTGELHGDGVSGANSLKKIKFEKASKGRLLVWDLPDDSIKMSNRYVCFADIGGRSDGADYSCIKVFDRYWMSQGGVPEVVALWHGHLDQDLFAWKCAQIAKFYDDALLAVEVNSLAKEDMGEGEHFLTVLDEIVDYYENIYARTDPEKVREGIPIKYGFHTNKLTKPMIIDALNKALREGGYVERNLSSCDEMDYYEIKKNGSYGAVEGQHDDLVVITAGGVWLCYEMPIPKIITETKKKKIITRISESTI